MTADHDQTDKQSHLGFHCMCKQTGPTIFLQYKTVFFLPKQRQKSISILKDGSRSLGLFRKGKTHVIAKFHRTD